MRNAPLVCEQPPWITGRVFSEPTLLGGLTPFLMFGPPMVMLAVTSSRTTLPIAFVLVCAACIVWALWSGARWHRGLVRRVKLFGDHLEVWPYRGRPVRIAYGEIRSLCRDADVDRDPWGLRIDRRAAGEFIVTRSLSDFDGLRSRLSGRSGLLPAPARWGDPLGPIPFGVPRWVDGRPFATTRRQAREQAIRLGTGAGIMLAMIVAGWVPTMLGHPATSNNGTYWAVAMIWPAVMSVVLAREAVRSLRTPEAWLRASARRQADQVPAGPG